MNPRTALITGGAQGIGARTAHLLAGRGWRVLVADLNEGPAKDLAEELNHGAPTREPHLGFGVDVADEISVEGLFTSVSQETTGLDGLVNCAGNILRQPAEELDITQWRRLLDIHLTGSVLMAKAGFPLLKASRGSIVNIASVGSSFGLPGRSAYSTAKTGMLGLTRTLAVEWGRHGIRVNAVAPGYVNTEMVRSGIRNGTLNEESLLGRTPLGRLAEASEIASVIAFLLSPDASFIHGEVVKVDGGLTVDGTFD
ncbi:SDR family NAD(P)-dependent oxidoreductase [Paenarthrobacter ureafaciens]|uniref:SDR family NAD(P)-dependent oxidoreductase n=1 Tax=Paenarthrobacter ureafaciens TaxID=37931 RepID=UPI001FB2DCF1|nr:SDR family oxidoreductase [Paenarthrobacter ureafaciens]UOD80792.1 SDR family oxidoreductase [Paenarthrobacter ureafaciens]WNZ03451.1 SDR family oxidoreductase [Paenarthrobacter ureafaciens]